MDENKDSSNTVTPTQQTNVVVSDAEQAPQQNTQEIMDPEQLRRKNARKRGIVAILAVVVGIPLIFVVSAAMLFGVLSFGSDRKMDKLRQAADAKATTLSSIPIIDEQSTQAKGIVNGDSLTASDDPAISTHAEAIFIVDNNLASLDSQTTASLKEHGFVRDGSTLGPYYSYASGYGGSPSAIIFRYIKGPNAVSIIYDFDKSYACPEGKYCAYNERTKQPEKVYDVQSYGALRVVKMKAIYGDKSNTITKL